MADIVSKAKRSEIMSRIRSKGNQRTEIAMVKLFRANKITGWRRHYPIEGKPDFVFLKQRVAIFVDGCFWHGCPKCYRQPKTNRQFWAKKIAANKRRDRRVTAALRQNNWLVARFWQHSMGKVGTSSVLKRIRFLIS
jgi:DNA mismatch endonuclease (patch repair protein)